MIKYLFVFGTRPEAIKMAPLIKEFQKKNNLFEIIVCVTAQHREMLDQALSIFDITPDYDLNIMKEGQDLFDLTSSVIIRMRDVLKCVKPDLVFVHGDTATSTAAALAAFYLQIPVCHIEAGLRTNNIYSPWPEEMNRQITSRIATYHFCPTETSKANLLKEAISDDKIFVVGNTVIDALFIVLHKIKTDINVRKGIFDKLIISGLPKQFVEGMFSFEQEKNSRKIILITGHRRENFGNGFINICESIKELAIKYSDVDFIYPMHMNPNVRKPILEVFSRKSYNNIYFIEPLDYLPFIYLMSNSHILLTDSGGIQEEAPSLGKPVLVMRDTTERPEALIAGTVVLVGTDKEKIKSQVTTLLENDVYYNQIAQKINPYGDGLACERIVTFFKNKLS
jgi:UDP-N-acetylglucosamine 2-epimerase (non-hydrolysing)